MKSSATLAVALCMGWLGCSSRDVSAVSPVLPEAPPASAGTNATITTFEGTYDAETNSFAIVYRPPAGADGVLATLPYGTGNDRVDFHTLPGTTAFGGACGASVLCGDVQARNHYTRTVTGLTAIFDAIVPGSVTAVAAPYAYGTVNANSSSSTIVWHFSDPTNANFSFLGHADGTVVTQTGAATLSSSPTTVSLGSLNLGLLGANGSNTGTAASVHSTTTDTSSTDSTTAITSAKTGSAEVIVGDGDCTGQTLQPGGTCINGYILDCRAASGATAGAKSATFTYTDPASAHTTTITVSGTCTAATSGGSILTITPRTRNFGNVELQNSASTNITVRNTGTTSTGLISITAMGSTEFGGTGCGLPSGTNLAPGQACTLVSTFDCNTADGAVLGPASFNVTATAPDSGSTVTLALSGTCVCVASTHNCNENSDCCNGICSATDFTCN